MLKFFVVSFVLSGLTFVSSTADWCRMESCKNKAHLMCENQGAYLRGNCGPQVLVNELTNVDRDLIYRKMNGACDYSNNSTLCFVWDAELATMAQKWANMCEPQLNYCINIEGVTVFSSGSVASGRYQEDLAIEYIPFQNNIKHAADQFMAQVRQFKNNNQFIVDNARSFKIGCGLVKRGNGMNLYEIRVVCFFGLPMKLYQEIGIQING